MKTTVSLRIDTKVLQRLKEEAKSDDRSLNYLINKLLTKHVDSK